MKRLIILLSLVAIATSCSIMRPQQRAEYIHFLDYRPYTSAGFFLSPDTYQGKFEAIGQLDITVIPEQVSANKANTTKSKFADNIYGKPGIFYTYKEISAEELLELAVKNALDKGANGIVNLDIKRISNVTYSKYGTTTTLSHYEVSGLVIKTLD